jgi:hypothetical protein
MVSNELDYERVKFRLHQASVSGGALKPTLNFNIEVSYSYKTQGHGEAIVIFPSVLRFATGKQICYMIAEPPVVNLVEGSTYFNFVAELDYYLLSQIETNRNGDLTLEIFVKFADVKNQRGLAVFNMNGITITKSDWIEKFLHDLKYKEIMIFEMPKITNPEFQEVVDHFNKAFKRNQSNEHKEVLSECRQAMEAFKDVAKKKGFTKSEKNGDGKDVDVVDYKKLLNDDLGKEMSEMHRKIVMFLTTGSHHGKSIDKEDADFALMVTYALINLGLNKMT